jgi:hypothetical protein
VQEPPGGITAGQVLEVTTNPLLAVGGDSVTEVLPAVLVTVTFTGLP